MSPRPPPGAAPPIPSRLARVPLVHPLPAGTLVAVCAPRTGRLIAQGTITGRAGHGIPAHYRVALDGTTLTILVPRDFVRPLGRRVEPA